MRWLLERIVLFRQVYQALLAKLFSFLTPLVRAGPELKVGRVHASRRQ
jgi:hypothetical protein